MDAIYANKMRPTSRYECGDVETVASEKVWRGQWRGEGNTKQAKSRNGRNAVARTFRFAVRSDEVVAAAKVLLPDGAVEKKDGLAAREWDRASVTNRNPETGGRSGRRNETGGQTTEGRARGGELFEARPKIPKTSDDGLTRRARRFVRLDCCLLLLGRPWNDALD